MGLSLLVVVLHYRGMDDTLECLASLSRQTYPDIHTVVVDNGSGDNARIRLAEAHPWAEVLELKENRGWSGGNNAGITLAIERHYDVVCLLNNDTVVPEGVMARLMETIAFLGPCFLHPAIDSYGVDNEVQLDPAKPEPSDMQVTPVPGRDGLFEIDMTNGCCLLANVSVFGKIGLIDDRFFLLCEDTDIGKRASKAGYRRYCDASVRIEHKESRSFGGRRMPIKTYYGIRNILLFAEKHSWLSRDLLGFGRFVAWTLSGTAEAAGARHRSWWGLGFWFLSSNVFAQATRMGIRDYLLRRFGRINRRDEVKLRSYSGTA